MARGGVVDGERVGWGRVVVGGSWESRVGGGVGDVCVGVGDGSRRSRHGTFRTAPTPTTTTPTPPGVHQDHGNSRDPADKTSVNINH